MSMLIERETSAGSEGARRATGDPAGRDAAGVFCGGFFDYYNYEHRHSGIGFMTPADVHYGRAEQLTTARRQILLEAHRTHPERFVRGTPQPPVLPPQAWINPPTGGCVPRFVEKERRPPLRHQSIISGGNLRVFENLAQTLVAVDAS